MKSKSIFKNFASLGVLQIANYALPLIVVPIISRIIGPEKFGLINYTASFVAYFTLLISYGFDYSATRRIAHSPDDDELKKNVVSEVLFAKIFLLVISTIIFCFCLYNIPQLNNNKILAVYSFIICVGTVFNQTWLFQVMQDLPKMAILTFLSRLCFAATVIIIIKQQEDFIWQPLITSIVQIVVSIFSFFWILKRYSIKLKYVNFQNILKIIYSEKVIFFSLVVISLYTTTNVVILGFISSPTHVGYYSAAQKIIDVVVNVINMPLAQTLFPLIGFAFGESEEKGIKTVQKIFPLIIISTALLSLALIVIGPPFLLLFYGRAFANSVSIFKILIAVPLIVSVNNLFCVQIMLNLKMDKAFFIITAIGAILGVGLNIVMTKQFDYIGTAWNWVIVETYITLAAYFYLLKKGIHPIDFKQFKVHNIYAQLKPVMEKFNK